MDIAVVTGASSSLGIAISRRLIDLGFRVYGLGGDYRNCPLNNVDFKPINCDLSDGAQVMQSVMEIIEREGGICLVVNNAKFFPKDSFAEASPQEMDRSMRINLLTPLLIARCALPSLQRLQGFIINLGVSAQESARGGVIGAATSGGLRWAHEALFDEVRDYGVKVSLISPEPNRRPVTNGGSKAAKSSSETAIDPSAVAEAVVGLVQSRGDNWVTELVIRPRRWTSSELPPIVDLPYPDPKPIPYTVPRVIVEAEEELDEQMEDPGIQPDQNADESDSERQKADKQRSDERGSSRQRSEPQEADEQSADRQDSGERGSGEKKRRRRRRRRSGDRRDEPANQSDSAEGSQSQQAARLDQPARRDQPARKDSADAKESTKRDSRPAKSERSERAPASAAEPQLESADKPAEEAEGRRRRRRRGRKPAPPGVQAANGSVPFAKSDSPEAVYSAAPKAKDARPDPRAAKSTNESSSTLPPKPVVKKTEVPAQSADDAPVKEPMGRKEVEKLASEKSLGEMSCEERAEVAATKSPRKLARRSGRPSAAKKPAPAKKVASKAAAAKEIPAKEAPVKEVVVAKEPPAKKAVKKAAKKAVKKAAKKAVRKSAAKKVSKKATRKAVDKGFEKE